MRIPQLKSSLPTSKSYNINSYETKVENNIVWAFITSLHNSNYPHTNYPHTNIQETYHETLDKNPNKNSNTFMRELPYDYYMLLENFFDPSHVPFAHHKLQSYRSSGSPIATKLISNNETLIVEFKDEPHDLENQNYAKKLNPMDDTLRQGRMILEPPFYYKLQNLNKVDYIRSLHIFCIPIQRRKCRVIIQYEFDENSKFYKIYKKLPIWLQHIMTNKFFDSDTLLIQNQENNIINQITEISHINQI